MENAFLEKKFHLETPTSENFWVRFSGINDNKGTLPLCSQDKLSPCIWVSVLKWSHLIWQPSWAGIVCDDIVDNDKTDTEEERRRDIWEDDMNAWLESGTQRVVPRMTERLLLKMMMRSALKSMLVTARMTSIQKTSPDSMSWVRHVQMVHIAQVSKNINISLIALCVP